VDPLEAPTSPDPYPFYRGLISQSTLRFDGSINMWVAASFPLVSDILSHPLCGVRPLNEPVPTTLLTTKVGDVFSLLMRMNEGPRHCPLKRAATSALTTTVFEHAKARSKEMAASFAFAGTNESKRFSIQRTMFELPSYVLGSLLGIPEDDIKSLVAEVHAFASALAVSASGEQIVAGHCAVESLVSRFSKLLEGGTQGEMLRQFLTACSLESVTEEQTIANLVGLLLQNYEATAGLIGNSLVCLHANSELLPLLDTEQAIKKFLWEVLRFDPPVQNTRRFALEAAIIGGASLPVNAPILVILAAANRDPARFTDPDTFMLDRSEGYSYSFGLERHECPAKHLAVEIAAAVLSSDRVLQGAQRAITGNVAYRPSANTRIPLL
jgi:cytochrome P450